MAASSSVVDVVFVRHGESEGNLATTDPSTMTPKLRKQHTYHYLLTPKGVEQAKDAGMWIKTHCPKFDKYYCSDYARTKETAAILDIPGAMWRLDTNLRESSIKAHVSDKNHDETLYCSQFNDFLSGMVHVDMFLQQRIFCSKAKSVLVVCHANVIRFIRFRLEHMSQAEHFDTSLKVDNGEVLWYSRRNNKPTKLNRLYDSFKFKTSYTPLHGVRPLEWVKIPHGLLKNHELLEVVKKDEEKVEEL
jgi:broad specificity phosphatase PhoE